MILYLVTILLLVVLELLYFRIADRFNIIDKPNLRSSHTRITIRGGGIVFLLGVWIYGLFYGFHYPWFLAGLTAIAGISFVDDMCSLPNKFRLVVHFVSMLLMFQELGVLKLDSWWIVLVGLILCVGVINAYNFMDGINGITGGYSLAVLFPLLYVNNVSPYMENDFLITVVLSVCVFCLFNFRKKARCFAGDVGAVAIAFILLFALGKLILRTGDFTYIVFLAVYGVDSVLTIIHRILLHENIGEAHRKHAYQLMANELGIPHVVVSLVYMGIQVVISFGLVLFPVNKWLYLGGVVLLLSMTYVLFKKRYYHLHEEYLRLREG